jgi:4-amino-4-deoxy-L-arabinose transferase-like glycosyltransferase
LQPGYPWKPDEAYTFGLIDHIIKTGDLVVPSLAGEPFMEKPPLYFITAAAFAKLFSPWLALHDGARLASGFFTSLTLLFVGLAGRELYGPGKGFVASATFIACLGLLIPSHQMVTDVALVTGFSVAFFGFALSRRRPILGGLALGTGVGVGFMSKGLLAPGTIGLSALFLPILFRQWRTKEYVQCIAAALIAAAPWLGIWPYLLYKRAPALFEQWLWVNNFGRFFGFVHLGPHAERDTYLITLPWFAWPALPFAILTLWDEKLGGLRKPEIQLPLTVFAVTLGTLGLASDARELYALPLLIPLAALAVPAFDRLGGRLASAFNWVGIGLFALLGGVLWMCWTALHFRVPSFVDGRLQRILPGHTPQFSATLLTVGLVYVLGWLLVVRQPLKERPILVWVSGATMVWGVAMTQLVSWLDEGNSYRTVMLSLKQALPAKHGCIGSHGLGEPQRAMLEYYDGIVTRRDEVFGPSSCEYLLVQATDQIEEAPEWRKIWEGRRPGDRKERYELFQRSRQWEADDRRTPSSR